MIENLKELNEKINVFVDYVVKTACMNTTSGNFFVSVEDALKASGMTYEDYLSYKDVVRNEIEAREEVLELGFDKKQEEFDVNCALDYCPSYEWCDGDEAVFECSYEEWLEKPVKPVTQLGNSNETNPYEPDVYFTVRDMFGDDVGDKYISTYDEALKSLKVFCSQKAEVSDNAMLGIVCKDGDKIHRCVLVQNRVNEYGESVLKPMHDNILREDLKVPQIELASLRAKQLQYPFDEKTQGRIDALEKMLGIYDRDVDTTGDLYVGKWRVHVVAPGAHYGLNNCLTNDEKQSLVEFWDMSPKNGDFPNGQFVSRYYVETLLDDKWGPSPEKLMQFGLCLDGLNADSWSVTGNEMKTVFEWLKNRELLPGEHYLEYHCDMDVHVPPATDFVSYLSEKLNLLASVRDVGDIECVGVTDHLDYGYSFSFNTQANKDTLEKAFANVFGRFGYELACEEKVVEVQKEPLDKVIKDCSAKVKDVSGNSNKNKDLDRE